MVKNRRILKCFLAAMLIGISVNRLYGQDNGGGDGSGGESVGSSSAVFMQFTPSARASGMGEAFVALSGLDSIVYNPAALAPLRYKEGSVMHSSLYQENKINFITGVLPLTRLTLGAHLFSFSTPSEPVYDWSGEETGEEINYSGLTAGVAAAMMLTDNISAGIGVKTINEEICDLRDTAMGFDIGGFASYPMSDDTIQLGISFSNLGARIRDEEDAPSINRFGAAYLRDAFTASAEIFDAKGNDGAQFKVGAEYCYKEAFSPRIGLKTGNDNENITLGFGLRYRYFNFDYSYIPNNMLGTMHRIGLGARLGAPVEERIAKPSKTRKKKATRKFKKSSDDLLNIAVAELSGKNVSAMDAAIVADFIRTELVRTRTFKVLDRQNMEQLLEEQSFQLTGCTTEECAVQMGKVLNVSYMVVGTFSKFLETYYVNVNFVDVETGEIVAAESAECASGKELPEAAKKISDSFAEQFSR